MALNKKSFDDPIQNKDNVLIIRIRNHRSDSRLIMELFNRYLPLVKSLYGQYSIVGMDFDDWKQEALIVMLRVINRYDSGHYSNFGPFYRTGLRNCLYDLLRKQNAQKRIPHGMVTSFDSNDNLYFDTLKDVKATCPDNSLLISEDLQEVWNICSPLEKRVLLGVIQRRTFEELSKMYKCSITRIMNAFHRCRYKFKHLRNTLN